MIILKDPNQILQITYGFFIPHVENSQIFHVAHVDPAK